MTEPLQEGEIEIPVWWKHGSMMTRRSCLPLDHPESEYSYIKNLGKRPEDYGVTRAELIGSPNYERLKEDFKTVCISKTIAHLEKNLNLTHVEAWALLANSQGAI